MKKEHLELMQVSFDKLRKWQEEENEAPEDLHRMNKKEIDCTLVALANWKSSCIKLENSIEGTFNECHHLLEAAERVIQRCHLPSLGESSAIEQCMEYLENNIMLENVVYFKCD